MIKFFKSTRHGLDTWLLILWHLEIRRVIVRVLFAGLNHLFVVVLVREFAHQSIFIWRANSVNSLVLAHMNSRCFMIRGSEVFNVLNFTISITRYLWSCKRTYTGLEYIASLFPPARRLDGGTGVHLIYHWRDDQFHYFRIAYFIEVWLFFLRVLPALFLQSAWVWCHVQVFLVDVAGGELGSLRARILLTTRLLLLPFFNRFCVLACLKIAILALGLQ